MKPFTYFAPADLSESVSMWNRYYDDAKLLAGGTDLIVLMKKGIFTPAYVIDLKRIRQLRIIERRNGRLMVGALATATEIAYSPEVRESLPGLAEAASCIGSEQIRNRATIGGNICRAAPSGDFAPILLAMDAKCVIAGPQGDRHLPVEELFISPGRNALGQGEILKELEITIPVTKWNAHYERFSYRDTLDMALTGAAVYLETNADRKTCTDVRIGLASVAPTPFRAVDAERFLAGRELTPANIESCALMASRAALPIDDVYGPSWYKRKLVEVVVKRAIRKNIEVLS